MRTIWKAGVSLTMAAMCVTVALAGPAAAKRQVPFQGFLHGVEIDVVQGASLLVDGSGSGIASHLGRVTVTWDATVDLSSGSATGSVHLTAANGDSIFSEFLGQGDPTETPGVSHIVEINTITGGTGRFAGVAGSFTVERLVDLTTGRTAGWFHGTMTSPGAAH